MNDVKMHHQTFWIAGKKISREEMDSTHVLDVQKLLKIDYERGVRPRCLCNATGVEMTIRKLPSRYVIAKMPDSGHVHDANCDSYSPEDADIGVREAKSHLPKPDANGTTWMKLNVALSEKPEQLTNRPVRHFSRESRHPSSGQTSLLGLLQHAWSESGLNRWHPNMASKRGWRTIHRLINEYATTVVASKRPLQSRLFIPAPFNLATRLQQLEEFQEFMQPFEQAPDGTVQFAILIGEVTTLASTRFGGRISIKHLKDFNFWLSSDAYEKITQRFERAIRHVNEPETLNHVVGIFLVRRSNEGQSYHVRTGALMVTNANWIPVESSYERQIADALVASNRHFMKPLRYDCEDDVVLPDFLLLDLTSKPVPMEIYGMSGNNIYETRKLEKVAYYRQSGHLYWQWDVGETDRWPPFPSLLKK